jgi:hypothetical protein
MFQLTLLLIALLTRPAPHALGFRYRHGTHPVRAAVQASTTITRVVGVGSASSADVDLWTSSGLTSDGVLLTSSVIRVPRLSGTNIREDKE